MSSHCDFIGCFDQPLKGEHFCAQHVQSRQIQMTPDSIRESVRSMFQNVSQTPSDRELFSRMLQQFCDPTNHTPVKSDEQLRSDILRQSTHQKSSAHVRQKHSTSKTSATSDIRQQTKRRVKRIIRERGGEKVTEEHEESTVESTQHDTLIKFKTEREIDLFVDETTSGYEQRLNDHAKNKELVFSCLTKWFEEVSFVKLRDGLDVSQDMGSLMQNQAYDLEQKQTVVYWQLWTHLWTPETIKAPVIQQITYYTIEVLPDGPRKVFLCKFSDNKLSPQFVLASVPEVLLRAIPAYNDIIRAFFVSKFIPFKKAFMKHQRNRELQLESKDEVQVDEALDGMFDDEESGGFKLSAFPEVDPRMCYHKVK